MSELSRVAKVVLDAAKNTPADLPYEHDIASALRAAALNFRTEMKCSVPNGFVRGVLAAATALEEIASELEAQ